MSHVLNDKFALAVCGDIYVTCEGYDCRVQAPFVKKLLVEGVGFKWEVQGTNLKLSLGFSHPVIVEIPKVLRSKQKK